MARIDIKSAGATLNDGVLQLENGVAMDTTLRNVADQNNTTSPLKLSTTAVQVVSPFRITTDDPSDMYLDCEDGSANNRFNITRNTASQQVNLNFASNPGGSTTTVGAIRTFTDGVNLGEVVKFREDGQVTFTERVNVEADSLVTTQSSSVIAASTTNASLVIAPNGTGSLVASIPDGTTTGGNARGSRAVDLQMSRYNVVQVASGADSFIGGGANSRATAQFSVAVGGNQQTAAGYGSFAGGGFNNAATGTESTIVGGNSNNSVGNYSFVGGGQTNAANSSYSTISGGQSNTASTNTHATIVGGSGNTSSGQYSVSGGQSNTASGTYSVALGYNNQASNQGNVALGFSNTVSGNTSMAGPRSCTASGEGTVALGFSAQATGFRSYALGSGVTASGVYTVALGSNNNAYNAGMITTFAGDAFTTQGDCQRSMVTQRYVGDFATGGTALLEILAGGSSSRLIPSGNNRAWNVQVNWVAIVTSITGTATGISVGDVITSVDLLAFKKIAGVSSASSHTSAGTKTMVTTPAQYSACQITYAAGTSQSLALTFTAPTFVGGGTVNMRIVATLELTEVAF